ncbi:hypothetical protein BDK51DRAFT_47584 [Blyttiomyces helicus]|uniref:Uncharacterized protein n=1 Tax=Blyttiomyces helicus TaxID=388810 RepID=A0A4P9WCW4_9FUNG|nr:hypothetical protein BDK51DRAFT_47584 [Blyttiomyces helicus]|eukprot:RKO89463.1 hypothetical protein BDK51DRAFT_47584 [Blyttiomyces helicus]
MELDEAREAQPWPSGRCGRSFETPPFNLDQGTDCSSRSLSLKGPRPAPALPPIGEIHRVPTAGSSGDPECLTFRPAPGRSTSRTGETSRVLRVMEKGPLVGDPDGAPRVVGRKSVSVHHAVRRPFKLHTSTKKSDQPPSTKVLTKPGFKHPRMASGQPLKPPDLSTLFQKLPLFHHSTMPRSTQSANSARAPTTPPAPAAAADGHPPQPQQHPLPFFLRSNTTQRTIAQHVSALTLQQPVVSPPLATTERSKSSLHVEQQQKDPTPSSSALSQRRVSFGGAQTFTFDCRSSPSDTAPGIDVALGAEP